MNQFPQRFKHNCYFPIARARNLLGGFVPDSGDYVVITDSEDYSEIWIGIFKNSVQMAVKRLIGNKQAGMKQYRMEADAVYAPLHVVVSLSLRHAATLIYRSGLDFA